jgi:hypothetical protein
MFLDHFTPEEQEVLGQAWERILRGGALEHAPGCEPGAAS